MIYVTIRMDFSLDFHEEDGRPSTAKMREKHPTPSRTLPPIEQLNDDEAESGDADKINLKKDKKEILIRIPAFLSP